VAMKHSWCTSIVLRIYLLLCSGQGSECGGGCGGLFKRNADKATSAAKDAGKDV
jgi:hypothetical protein